MTADYVLIGGGLQNALLACAISNLQPSATLVLVERAARLGGNHTWCFHGSDLAPELEGALAPLIEHTWSGYDVAFPRRQQTLNGSYHCITSERLHAHVSALFARQPGFRLCLEQTARPLSANEVELGDGERVRTRAIVDARGPEALSGSAIAGYQKFLGLEVELDEDHSLERPLLMDATVPQIDGFRFVYVLPFGSRRALFEDTYFAEQPELDRHVLRQRLHDYILARGLHVSRVLREEVGVLPLPARMPAPSVTTPIAAGYQGGWFHPTTGYSFPVAARLALAIATQSPEALAAGGLRALGREHGQQLRFATLLNRMMFGGFEDGLRRNVFERFYGLSPALIARFYALQTTPLDRARILCGRPPRGISLRRALNRGMSS